MAAEKQAYVLTDKATFLAHGQSSRLSLLLERSAEMMNTYSLIAVSPVKWPDTNVEGARAFIEWMKGNEAQSLIARFGEADFGEPLFYLLVD
jgi:tungstate transport system substrate-binding protein